ncbi:MAG: HigA family addiction module antitoxin [Candidatus Omnitrophica bacterium]|nr:HigA family addiction module antitoxin [Candidatus Omnitrophota bacterium]
MLPKNRMPTHPGEILRAEFLEPLEMSQTQLAEKMGVPIKRINSLVSGKRGMTPETALLLSGVFKTSPEFWMNLQVSHDLAVAAEKMARAH